MPALVAVKWTCALEEIKISNVLITWRTSWADKMNRTVPLTDIELSCTLGIRALSRKENLCFISYNKSFTDQPCSVKMAGYWPPPFFACLWTETKSRSLNTQKKELGQYPAILTEQGWSITKKPIVPCMTILLTVCYKISANPAQKNPWKDWETQTQSKGKDGIFLRVVYITSICISRSGVSTNRRVCPYIAST